MRGWSGSNGILNSVEAPDSNTPTLKGVSLAPPEERGGERQWGEKELGVSGWLPSISFEPLLAASSCLLPGIRRRYQISSEVPRCRALWHLDRGVPQTNFEM